MSDLTPQIIEAEEIPIEQAVEKTLLTELEKLEITKKFLEEKRDECLELKLNGQDKEAYSIIRETRLNMKTRRVAIEKICKKKREDATRTQKAWIAVEKDWTKIVSAGEDYLQKLEDEFESEQERIKSEAKRKMEEAFILRQADLTKMGATYVDGSFVLDEVSYEAILVKEADEDLWNGTIKKQFNDQYLINREKELLEEVRKSNEKAALERQQKELERKQQEIADREAVIKKAEEDQQKREQDERDRKSAEEKAKKDALIKARSGELAALGMKYDFNDQQYLFEDVSVTSVAISVMDETEWTDLTKMITPIIAQKKEVAEQKRISDIEEEKRIAAEKATKIERERIEKVQADAELKRQQEDQRKAEELAQASDKEKWADFLTQLNKLSIPDMRSGQYRKKISIAKEKLGEISEL